LALLATIPPGHREECGEFVAQIVAGRIEPRGDHVDIPLIAGDGLYLDRESPLEPLDIIALYCRVGLIAGRWLRTTETHYLLRADNGLPGATRRIVRRTAAFYGVAIKLYRSVEHSVALWTPELRAAYWAQPEKVRRRQG